MSYNQAQTFFENADYESAFELFKKVAEDSSEDMETRSNSYAMLGSIIFNFVDVEDVHAGIDYFRRSLELSPDNIGALLNIIQTFSPKDATYHNDKTLFMEAYDKLINKLRNELTAKMMSEVLAKYEKVKDFL